LKLCDSDLGVTATDGFELFVADGGDAYIWQRENNPLLIGTNGSERMRLTSAGNVGIGTTSPEAQLHIAANNDSPITTGIRVARTTIPGQYVNLNYAVGLATLTAVDTVSGVPAFKFQTSTNGSTTTERARIDSSGRLLVGTSTARANFTGGTRTSSFQVEGTSLNDSALSILRNSNDTGQSGIYLAKSRSTTVGDATPDIVADGDSLGTIFFQGADNTNFVSSASITAQVDGTPGANDMPGRLVFSTTADGAASPTERMRITSDGYVRLASSSGGIQFNGDTAAANALDDYEEGTFTPTILQGITSPVYNVGNTRGTYRVIGRQVFFSLRVTLTGGTADANQLRVGGLPFNPALSVEYRVIHVGLFQTGASSTPVHAVGYSSTASMDIVDSSDRTIVTGNEATNVLDLQITGVFPI